MANAKLPKDLGAELDGTPYRWVRGLARGGMGEVHVVEHKELGTPGVLKVIRQDLREATDIANRLRVEARLLKRMEHRNLVRVLDLGWTQSGRAFFVCELLEGESLGDRLKRERTFAEPFATAIAVDVLTGLAHAHEHGLVHRDVKPDNIFLVGEIGTATPLVKVLDFGVAKLVTDEAKDAAGGVAPTAAGLIIGTPQYMAPEQVRAAQIDARTDVYAVGCLLYRMLVGEPPFMGNDLEVFQDQIATPPDAPAVVARERVSAAMNDLILRALAKDPSARFESADAMRKALIEIAQPKAKVAPATHTVRIAPVSGTERLVGPVARDPRPQLVEPPRALPQTTTERLPSVAAAPARARRTVAMPEPAAPVVQGAPEDDGPTIMTAAPPSRRGEARRLRVALAISVTVICLLLAWILLGMIRRS